MINKEQLVLCLEVLLPDLADEQHRPLHANCSAVSHMSLNNKSVEDSVLPSRNMSAACKNKEA